MSDWNVPRLSFPTTILPSGSDKIADRPENLNIAAKIPVFRLKSPCEGLGKPDDDHN
ncbi:hypothetical protein JXA32_06195 [Candidatus Sumerlaeota bacterium]|nr:hypothetical protein [Candidatus Sumerlaeota bacterium]